MRRVRTLTLAILAVTALGAISVSTASAKLPEWGKCLPTESGSGGKYADSNCVVPVKKVYGKYAGGYEWAPEPNGAIEFGRRRHEEGFNQPEPGAVIETANGKKITCPGELREESTLFFDSTRTPEIEISEFAGCVNEAHEECREPGQDGGFGNYTQAFEEEEHGWHSKLGYVSGKGTSGAVVGIEFAPNHKHENMFAQILCEGGGISDLTIGGGPHGGNSFIGVISPVNQMTNTYTYTLRQHDGVQSPSQFEKGGVHTLEAFGASSEWEPVGIEATMVFAENPNGYEAELKATP